MNYILIFIEENKTRIGEVGAIETILNGMKIHTNNIAMCRHGCIALEVIGFNGKTK